MAQSAGVREKIGLRTSSAPSAAAPEKCAIFNGQKCDIFNGH